MVGGDVCGGERGEGERVGRMSLSTVTWPVTLKQAKRREVTKEKH